MIDMKIEGYHITSDKYGLTVSKLSFNDDGTQKFTVNAKTGDKTPIENTMGSYGNLAQALAGIRKNMLYTGDKAINDLNDYRSESNRIENLFDEYINDQMPATKYEFN